MKNLQLQEDVIKRVEKAIIPLGGLINYKTIKNTSKDNGQEITLTLQFDEKMCHVARILRDVLQDRNNLCMFQDCQDLNL